MAPAKRRAKVRMVRERSTSADDENEATTDDVRGSQGSDDQSVSNMAKALKESVGRFLHVFLASVPDIESRADDEGRPEEAR